MNITLDPAELIALAIAQQAVRALPVKPNLHSFPFLGINDLQVTEKDDEYLPSKWTVSFMAEMHSGTFFEDYDGASCPKFVIDICYDKNNSTYYCESGHIEFDVAENRFDMLDFNATVGENGEILITRV
jgi:hypothetical protein